MVARDRRTEAVKFGRPPVAEVACGVLFGGIHGFKTAHVGLFWSKVQENFPRIEDVPPLDPVVEDLSNFGARAGIEFSPLPPMRRSWFISEDGAGLLQVQPDRFLFNWKRQRGNAHYPSYENVIARFEEYYAEFMAFLEEQKLGAAVLRQFELTYVNLIEEENGLREVGKHELLVDHMRDTSRQRFLPEAETFNWASSYLLPDAWGRLRVSAQTAALKADSGKVVRLELTARGVPPELPERNMRAWFDVAHEWITRGFADSTSEKLHAIWDRTS